MSNFELFIAKRIINAQGQKKGKSAGGTRPIIRIAILGIILGLAIMILTVSIVKAFQSEIRSKVIGFGSHIQICSFNSPSTYEPEPVSIDQKFYPSLNEVEGIRNIQVFASKIGIISTEKDVQGVLVKGIGTDFDWSFFKKALIKGDTLSLNDSTKSNDVMISNYIAKKLELDTGDRVTVVFIQNDVERKRRLSIKGIYETGMEQFDREVILADIGHIRKIYGWAPTEVGGFEVILNEYEDLENIDEYVYKHIGFKLNTIKITDQFSEIFGWLDILDINVIIILTFSIIVSGISMISALLILILDRTHMIGLLKAMGAKNWSIQSIFLYNAAYLIGKGMFWGNVLGLGLCWLQYKFQLITLPQETYYLSTVPIEFNWLYFGLLNVGAFSLCMIMLIIPSYVVTKISPVKTIKFN